MDDGAHERIYRHPGAEACGALFDNVDVASVLDEILSKCVVRLRWAGINRPVSM